MRILLAHTRYLQRGGEESIVERQQSILADGGHEVALWEPANPSMPRAQIAALARAGGRRDMAIAMKEHCQRFRPDIVSIHNTWYAMTPSVIAPASASGAGVLVSFHNFRFACINAMLLRDEMPCHDCVTRNSLWPGIQHRCYHGSLAQSVLAANGLRTIRRRDSWNDADALVVQSEWARTLATQSGLPDELLTIVHNAAEDPGERDGPPSASHRLMFAGRLAEEKGVASLVALLPHLESLGLHLDVFGDGPRYDDLARSANANLTLHGFQDRSIVAEAMRHARALLFPSTWYEGEPGVVLEAMAAGLPVVSRSLGGLGELLGDDGVTIRDEGPDGLWRTLDDMSDNSLDHAGAAGRRRWAAAHEPHVVLSSLERAFESALTRAQERTPR